MDDNKLYHTLGSIETQLRNFNDNIIALRKELHETTVREDGRHSAVDVRLRKLEEDSVRIHTITVVISGVVSFIVVLATSVGSILLRLFGK
ncbi:MAG: hypothetical protein ACWGQW_00035 [bacterium]